VCRDVPKIILLTSIFGPVKNRPVQTLKNDPAFVSHLSSVLGTNSTNVNVVKKPQVHKSGSFTMLPIVPLKSLDVQDLGIDCMTVNQHGIIQKGTIGLPTSVDIVPAVRDLNYSHLNELNCGIDSVFNLSNSLVMCPVDLPVRMLNDDHLLRIDVVNNVDCTPSNPGLIVCSDSVLHSASYDSIVLHEGEGHDLDVSGALDSPCLSTKFVGHDLDASCLSTSMCGTGAQDLPCLPPALVGHGLDLSCLSIDMCCPQSTGSTGNNSHCLSTLAVGHVGTQDSPLLHDSISGIENNSNIIETNNKVLLFDVKV
jgi:hypothetical protein